MKTNLKSDGSTYAQKYSGDLDGLKKAIRNVQSKKCMLSKRKKTENYEQAMSELLAEEQALKEARRILDPKERKVTEYTQTDVNRLDYDSARKALRSIQSTKCLTSTLEEDKSRYENACKIEKLIKARLNEIKPIDDDLIKKKDLVAIIDSIKTADKIKKDKIVEMLESLL